MAPSSIDGALRALHVPSPNMLPRRRKKKQAEYVIEGKSLFLFGPESKVRQVLKEFIAHPYFENLIYYMIAMNSILLALDEPALDNGYQKSVSSSCVLSSLLPVN